MTPNKDCFETLKETNGGQVILGNNKCCEVKGVKAVRIKMHDRVERVFQQVRYIPGLKRNLISLGTLDINGYSYKASGGVMTVVRGCMVVINGLIENGLHVLQGSTTIGMVTIVQEKLELNFLKWHRRLAHVSERGLMELQMQGLLDGDKLGKLEFCEHCILGKAIGLKFSRPVHTTTSILNYIYSNLRGPSQHPTLGGGRYFFCL